MDITYYSEQIKDQLDGATDYIKRAINCKAEHPQWAATYAKMSEMELGHAENLVKIFGEDFKECTKDIPDEYLSMFNEISQSINDMYTEFGSKIKYMHEIYRSK